jgi:lipoprotein-anchoring transpeptidase ErfK/SrfK
MRGCVLFPMDPQTDEAMKKRPGKYRILLAAASIVLCAGAVALVYSTKFYGAAAPAARWVSSASVTVSAAPSSSPSSAPADSSSAGQLPAAVAPQTSLSKPAVQTIPLDQAVKPLSLQVSISRQNVTVLDAKGRVVKVFTCSTGKKGSATPTGTFTVAERGQSFYNSSISEGAYYWTQFYGDYLFHSVPFNGSRELEPAEAAKLGTPASHGCVRLAVADAKWIYDNIPKGTRVSIA